MTNPLLAHIRRRIENTGPLSVADYMAECLCHPQHGYYMSRDPLGQAGDFTTAPEISQMFGEMIGLWLGVTWQQMGAPSPIHIVELGGGRGTLMRDALRAADKVAGFSQAAAIHMVEISPVLQQKQQASLADWGEAVSWHADIDQLPAGPSLIIANEFFDALPVRQFEKGAKGWAERFVDLDLESEGLRFVLQADEAARALMPAALKDRAVEEGALFELGVPAQSIALALGQKIAAEGGAVLAIDYGYAEADFGDTLQALKNHQFVSPLEECGTADLTTHVNFGMLGEALKTGGVVVHPLLGQGMFLEYLGITARAQALLDHAAEESQKGAIVAAHKRLCDPAEMGQLFKVLCATDPRMPPPPPFNALDPQLVKESSA